MRTVGSTALALHTLPVPTVARVDGVAIGAGMNLALACDFVVCTDRARFAEIFVKRGLSIDFGGSWILPRLVGLRKAKELTLLGELIDAPTALELGLVHAVVAPEELDAAVDELVQRLRSGPPIAAALSKAMLNEAFDVTLAQALDHEGWAQSINAGTKDTHEAVRAFLEKRAPRFEGR
jgi:2-(1,2-epoxy-1,2-dihydrophenyl)acetyl-CoA isomerase